MKMKIAILTLAGMISSHAYSQSVEYDDMYFNRKDREKQREITMASNQSRTSTQRTTTNTSKSEQMSRFNPTDSYSARNVNPDNSQNLSATGKKNAFADDEYLPEEYADGYRNAQMAQTGNSMYNSGFYGPRFSAWNSPYFGMGGMYDPWMMSGPMWGGPSMMSMNMGFYGRNSMMWGMNPWMMDPFMQHGAMAFNSWAWDPWFSPRWGSMSGFYGGMYGGGMHNNFWGRNNWGCTTVVIVGDNYNSHISRTRRPSRGGSFNSTEYNNTNVRSRENNNVVSNNMNRQNNTGRYDNTRNTTVNRYDSRQATTTRSNINTYQSRTSNTGVAPSSRQRVQSYSPVQQNNTRSYSPSSSNVGGMRSTGGNNSMGTMGSVGSAGSSRSSGSSVGSSSGGGSSAGSSGGSRSRGGN